MRHGFKRRDPRRTWCLLLCCGAVLCGLVVGVGRLDSRLRPLIQIYGYMSARRSAMLAVHTAVERVLSQTELAYSEYITVVRSDEGRVLSAETDVVAVNRLKSAASNEAMKELSAREEQTTKIPLGSLIGGSFFTGRGPFLSVPIHTSGAVVATLTGEFTDAGINQTRHSLYLNMTVMMTAALPMERVYIELETQFLVCEAVLVGEVPDTVLQLDLGTGVDKFFGAGD